MICIDLNADMGERPGAAGADTDRALLGVVTSANVACGFHAGGPGTMARTAEWATGRGVHVGAHVGLPDRKNFGRVPLRVSPDDVYAMTLYQIGALDGFLRRWGQRVAHVKPHGALYHMAEAERTLAEAIAYAAFDARPDLRLFALSGGQLARAGRARGLPVWDEVYADRAYLSERALVPRDAPGALIEDPQQVAARITLLLQSGALPALDGSPLSLRAETVCLHSDHPGALARAQALRQALEAVGIGVGRAP